MPDPVIEAVSKLRKMLAQIPHLGSVLTNGNVEKQLKLFIAAALAADERVPGGYRCVADKQFNPMPHAGEKSKKKGAELDLLALARAPANDAYAQPSFWMEVKCSFREGDLTNAASKALAQLDRYLRQLRVEQWRVANARSPDLQAQVAKFREELLRSPVYVVHFLNSTPRNECALPQFLQDKYPGRNRPAKDYVTREQLKNLYEEAARSWRWGCEVFEPVVIGQKPQLDVVVSKFNVCNGFVSARIESHELGNSLLNSESTP